MGFLVLTLSSGGTFVYRILCGVPPNEFNTFPANCAWWYEANSQQMNILHRNDEGGVLPHRSQFSTLLQVIEAVDRNSSKLCEVPSGHRTSTLSIFAAVPSPKCSFRSLCDR